MTPDGRTDERAGTATGELPSVSATVLAIAAAVAGVLPAFLTGALAVQMRAELGFGPGALGLAVFAFFGATAAASRFLGRKVDAVGGWAGVWLSAAVAALSLVGVAAAPSIWWVGGWLAVGGLANALAQPAVNSSLLRSVGADHLGVMFGVKQSAVPAATLTGGVAVPVVALVVGWRLAFVLAAAGALALAGIAARTGARHARPRPARPGPTPRLDAAVIRPLVLFALAAGLSGAAGNSLGAFLVDAGVTEVGLGEGAAALVLAVASVLTIGTRVGAGALADRRWARRPHQLILVLLGLGAAGHPLLASGHPVLFVVGALLAFGGGWGWPGVMHVTVVRTHRAAPAAATGILMTGFAFGSAVGPLVLGQVAERLSYGRVWWITTALVSGAGAAVWAGIRADGRAHRARVG